jgi:hypothetical protein
MRYFAVVALLAISISASAGEKDFLGGGEKGQEVSLLHSCELLSHYAIWGSIPLLLFGI